MINAMKFRIVYQDRGLEKAIQEAYEKVIELLVEIHKTSPVGKRYGA